MVILSLFMLWYGQVPTLGVVALPLLIALMMLAAAGLSLWLTALAVQYRDIRHAISFVVQLLLYAAPVIYPTSLIPEKYQLFYAINPMVGVIEGFRSALLGTGPMPWDLIAVGTVTAIVITATGSIFFARKEQRFADVA